MGRLDQSPFHSYNGAFSGGQPVSCSLGYATKEYRRDGEGNVTGEFYYDTQGKKAESSLGDYGQLYERDEEGRIIQITYLGIDGTSTQTNMGYAILRCTYYRDGNVNTERYFDAEGNPVALAKGQYGIKRSGKITLLLNKNGQVKFCVDNLLNEFPALVIVLGWVVCLGMLVLPRGLSLLLTGAYVFFIFYETLMFRENEDARTNFVLFPTPENL